MSLRVIGGSAKGRRLKMVPGDSTRAMTDRAKEALFSIIGRRIIGAAFLDLFSGTGSVAIEALSRGARQAVMLDLDRKAIETIYENLKITKLADRAIVRRTDALAFLKQTPQQVYQYIYVAPPQYKGMWLETLRLLDKPVWATAETTIVVQVDPREAQEVKFQYITEFDRRKYGKTLLWFFQASNLPPTSEG